MDNLELILTIVAAVLLLLSSLFGSKLVAAKGLLKEVRELLASISDALADNRVTKAEVGRILSEAGDVSKELKALLKR